MVPDNEAVNNKDVVLFALYEAGGAEKDVSTEHVAAKVFEYPVGRQRYRWEHFAEYPDKERVARELRRMKQAPGRPLVEGHVNVGAKRDRRDGWRLTPAGVERVKAMEQELTAEVGQGSGNSFVYDVEKLRRRLVSSTCFSLYTVDASLAEASDIDFTDLLYLTPDAPDARVRTTFDQLMAAAKAANADDLIAFLDGVRRRFAKFFERQEMKP